MTIKTGKFNSLDPCAKHGASLVPSGSRKPEAGSRNIYREATPGLVLASASPRRRELLAAIGMDPIIDPSTLPEPERRPGESPASYAVRAARGKAREVARRHPGKIIVGADTIVVVRNRFLGKPDSARDAARMLKMLSGRWHQVFTGVCVIEGERSASAHSCSRVHMKRLLRHEVDWYLSAGEYADKAGAYGIQGGASLFIDRIEGCYFNIVGFPIYAFARLCSRLGRRVPFQ
jgi:septum formation protein